MQYQYRFTKVFRISILLHGRRALFAFKRAKVARHAASLPYERSLFFFSFRSLMQIAWPAFRQWFSVIAVESREENRRVNEILSYERWLTVCQCQNGDQQQQHSDDVGGCLAPPSWRLSPHPYPDFSERTDFHLISHKKKHTISTIYPPSDFKAIADGPDRLDGPSYIFIVIVREKKIFREIIRV